jgi:hypothetical protein
LATNPFSTKTPNVSTITAAEINACGVAVASAVDGVLGGDYTPVSAPIRIGGAQGLRILSGGFLTILSGGTLSVPSGGIVTAAAGSTVTLAGTNVISGVTTASDLTMTGTSRIKLGSRSVSRLARSAPFGATNFTINVDSYVTQSSTAASSVSWELDVPHGATLTSVSIEIQPVAHGSLPATMPKLTVMVMAANHITGTIAGGPTSDGSGSVGAYNTQHPIAVSGLSVVVDRTQYNYWAKFEGEASTDSLTGLIAGTPSYTCTMTEMPDR